MLMHGLCGVSWRSIKSCFSQANSSFILNLPFPRSSFKPRLHIPPYVWSLWICKWNGRPLTRTQWWTGISILFRLEINWNWGTFWAGGVVIEGNIIKAVYCRDNPDILEQPRGASLFVRSSVGFEKTWSQSSVLCVCVWGRAVTLGFLSSGAVAVFSKTMWPCAVRVNTIG